MKKIRKKLTKIALRFDGRIFVLFVNALSFLEGSRTKFRYDNNSGDYIYTDPNVDEEIFFRHKSRAFLYTKGIADRSSTLANEYFLETIKLKNGDVVIDCGANIGELYFFFKLNNTRVKYIAFEPSPQEYHSLIKNVPEHICHNVGLWNENGDMEFFVSSEGADSSLIEPPHYDKCIKVKTSRLENYIDSNIKLLKLEAEGAEPEILQGIGNKLELIEYISADLGPERGISSESTLAPVTNYLLDRNFRLVDVSFSRVTALFKNKGMEIDS